MSLGPRYRDQKPNKEADRPLPGMLHATRDPRHEYGTFAVGGVLVSATPEGVVVSVSPHGATTDLEGASASMIGLWSTSI